MTKRERRQVESGAPALVREVVWRLYHRGKQLAEFETRKEGRAEVKRRGLQLDELRPRPRGLR